MHTLWQDMRYGVRMLAKNRGFTAIAVVTLTLGIGANTALFSVVNGVLLNPLPYYQPERLVAVYASTPEYPHSSISYPNFEDWRRNNHSFEKIAAFRGDDFNLTGMGEPERLEAEMVSAEFFPVLGVNPIRGRVFTEQEDRLCGTPVALISEGLWKRKFGAAPDVVGKPITLNATLYTIVGVIPASFRYESTDNFYPKSEVYVPIAQWNEQLFRDRRTGMGMNAVGRLRPGVTLEQAKADMTGVAALLCGNLSRHRQKLRRGTGAAEGERRWGHPALPADAAGGGGIRASDRVCECGQLAAGTRDGPDSGIRSTNGAGSKPGTYGAAGPYGKHFTGPRRGRAWLADRSVGDEGGDQVFSGCVAAGGRNSSGWAGAFVHARRFGARRIPVRVDSRAQDIGNRRSRDAEGRRARRKRDAAPHAGNDRSRGNGAGPGAADGRGIDDTEHGKAVGHESWIRPPQCDELQPCGLAAVGQNP